MLRIAITLCALALMPSASAICKLTRGELTVVSIASQVIRINANAPVDTSTPVAEFDSNPAGQDIGFNECEAGTEYGKRVLNLTGQDPSTRIYPTNIPGIGIKLLWSNGSAFGNFPSTTQLKFPGGQAIGTFDYSASSFYRIQFFKTANNLPLSPSGNTVLPAGDIAYNYLMTPTPTRVMTLNIGDIKIISTPTCNVASEKSIDFNEVTPSSLRNGVSRPLDFNITCQSDYGTYSATASMHTDTPSPDGSYIRVKDASGNLDRLGIKITDGAGKTMKLDGSTSERKNSIISQGAAEFAWKATLFASSKTAPAGGTFNAQAEVVFDIQ